MTIKKFKEILEKHKLWLEGNPEGIRAVLKNITFEEKQFPLINLQDAIITDCNFHSCYMPKANFKSSKIENTSFENSYLTNSDFSDTEIINCVLVSVFARHSNFTNSFISDTVAYNADLSDSDFTKASIFTSNFSNTILNNMDFSNADLSDSVFKKAIMVSGIFSETNFSGANMSQAICYNSMFENNKINTSFIPPSMGAPFFTTATNYGQSKEPIIIDATKEKPEDWTIIIDNKARTYKDSIKYIQDTYHPETSIYVKIDLAMTYLMETAAAAKAEDTVYGQHIRQN